MEVTAPHTDEGILGGLTWQTWTMLIGMVGIVALVAFMAIRVNAYKNEVANYQQNYVPRQAWMDTVNTPLTELQIGILDGKVIAMAPRSCFELGFIIRPDCRDSVIMLPIVP